MRFGQVRLERIGPTVNIHVGEVVLECGANLEGFFQLLIALSFLGQFNCRQRLGLARFERIDVRKSGIDPVT